MLISADDLADWKEAAYAAGALIKQWQRTP
jgi:hypothetical protein